MDYILQLREYIGHRPLLVVGAAVLVVDADERLLLLKRSDNHCWGPPGGGIEPGETVEAAARRETLEETGLEIGEMSLYGVFSGPELYYVYPNGDEIYNISIVYLTQRAHGEARLNEEHTEWGWFAAADIPDEISPPVRPVIERFKASA